MRTPVSVLLMVVLIMLTAVPALAWEPTKPIEFIVPAGTGGGADQMARLIAGIADKHRLSPRPLIVVNKAGGAGAEGFLHVKGKKGDSHTIVITPQPIDSYVPVQWAAKGLVMTQFDKDAVESRDLASFDATEIGIQADAITLSRREMQGDVTAVVHVRSHDPAVCAEEGDQLIGDCAGDGRHRRDEPRAMRPASLEHAAGDGP